MRSGSLEFQNALGGARNDGIIPRRFVWVEPKDRITGDVQGVGIWSGDYPITTDVIDGQTGLSVARDFTGAVNLDIGDIPRVSDLSIVSVDISFSAISTASDKIVREYDPRLARVEIHSGLIDPSTRQFVDTPIVEFLGIVDASPISTADGGSDSTTTLTIVSEAITMLELTNPTKRSYQGQKSRSNDEFGLYSAVVENWQVSWGE